MATSARTDPLLKYLVLLTAVMGIVDAAAFLGLGGIFTAFMTGNILFVGFAVAGGDGLEPVGCLTALLAFVAGSFLASRLSVAMEAKGRNWFLTAAVISSVLPVIAALVALGLPPIEENLTGRHYWVVAITAVAMGLRSATVRRLARRTALGRMSGRTEPAV